VTVTDGAFSKGYTATVGAGGTWSATIPVADAGTLQAGAANVSASVSDANGNVSQPANHAFSVERVAPTVSIATIAGDDILVYAETHAAGGVALTGSVSGLLAGQTFTVRVTDGAFSKTYTATVAAGGTSWSATLPTADAVTLADGTAVVTATVEEGVQASREVQVAQTRPVVTIDRVNGTNIIDNRLTSGLGPYQVIGTGTGSGGPKTVALGGTVGGLPAGAEFLLTFTDGPIAASYVATVDASGTRWSATIPMQEVGELPNGYATLKAQVTDSFGNTSDAAQQLVLVIGTTTTNHYSISGENGLEIFGASAATVAFDATAQGTLKLDNSAGFSGVIRGLDDNDVIDLADIAFGNQTTVGFTPNANGGVLRVSDGTHTATLSLFGNYVAAGFSAASDGHGGTIVTDPPAQPSQESLNNHLAVPAHV